MYIAGDVPGVIEILYTGCKFVILLGIFMGLVSVSLPCVSTFYPIHPTLPG